ncbi:MAG: hypothetical protein IJN92_09975 [Lachnospiraceae bacterium]|nr:hypothetical protein [Lachnospiraceae bacterium]
MNEIFYPKQLLTLKNKRIENQCFFVMPFAQEYENLYDTLSLYLENQNYKPVRVDKNSEASVPIITLILNGIATSQYIIVDISESNANVFYELGIAQTLKEPNNIFIIKEKAAKTPFDIQHLQYISYDKNNLKKLALELVEKLESCQYKNDFWNALNSQNFIDEKQLDMFVEYCLNVFSEDTIKNFTYILLNHEDTFPLSDSTKRAILILDEVFRKETRKSESEKYIPMLQLLLNKLVMYCSNDVSVIAYVQDFLNLTNYGELRLEQLVSFQTDMVIELALNSKLEHIALRWIIEYFQKSKSTKVDLNRYKLESFLLRSNTQLVNEYIINAIVSENHYIREHMADIAGEKNLVYAEENLIIQLKREDNIYTTASIMEALGKIKSNKGSRIIYEWVEKNAEFLIQKSNYFVLKHARNALKNIDETDLLILFDKKYLEILKNNNAL